MISFTLIRSKRKTVAIYISGGAESLCGGVEVRAPLRMPKRDIDRFVASKEKWITDKLTHAREQAERREAFTPGYGDTVMLRGAQYAITARSGTRAGFDGEVFYMPPGLEPEQIKKLCVQIYRRLAKAYLPERVAAYMEQMGAAPAAVKINGAKTRWGSCSSKRSVNFSWRLMMADDGVIDYVVVHELTHLSEMNHSPRFWAIVESILPDYRERQKRLRALQERLAGENWG